MIGGLETGLVVVVALAVAFAWTNGFHDASNAIATSVSTRALTPRLAIVVATVANTAGAFFGQGVAGFFAELFLPSNGAMGLPVLAGALGGAIVWNLGTWRLGLPSSSTHALIGGLVGAGLAAGASVRWVAVVDSFVVPMVVSPVVGFALAWLAMVGLTRRFRLTPAGELRRGLRYAQTISAVAVAFGHGMQDAAKTAGVIALALVVTGRAGGPHAPWWALALAAVGIGAGTLAGGWRVTRTLGWGLTRVGPGEGFAAETLSSLVLYGATILRLPISTTYVVTSAIAGAGTATRGHLAVRWGLVRRIVLAWALTVPGAALVGALACDLFQLAD
ncbi:MAG: anion permease [Nostocoides sp.]